MHGVQPRRPNLSKLRRNDADFPGRTLSPFLRPTVKNVVQRTNYQRRLALIVVGAVGAALLSQSAVANEEGERMKSWMYGLNRRSGLIGGERVGSVENARDQSEEIALTSMVCHQVDY